MAFIRPYKASDEEAVIHIFRGTAAPDLRADTNPDVLHIGEYIWARPYYTLRPDWCFVVDDGNDVAVGYILCAPDTASFVKDYREQFISVIEAAGIKKHVVANHEQGQVVWLRQTVYGPEDMLHLGFPTLLKEYPAHLHIDILPSHQGKGFGPKLLDTLFTKLSENSVPGLHLGMAAANDRAGVFYARNEFRPFEEMKGPDGQIGRHGGAIFLVKKVPEIIPS